jgi:RNA polymerase sigma-70 factor (ECF subfamily)
VTNSDLTDEVVRLAARGEPAALRLVYTALSPRVLGYLQARGVADAEAVTGDVFLALLPRIPKLTGGASGLRTLTFSIAHARVVDEFRSRARRPVVSDYDAAEDDRVTDSAEDDAQQRLATARVLEVLSVLPADQRDVLAMRVVGDLSIEQIASVIGRSTGAVKQLQRRALIGVRQALAERQVTL